VESHDTYFHQEIQNYTYEASGLQQFPKKNDSNTMEGKSRAIYIFLDSDYEFEIAMLRPQWHFK
jgi:hypothetical protein